MSIRRLVLDDDDDEEEQEHQQEQEDEIQPQPPTVTVTATRQTSNSNNYPSEPVQISDDEDFVDVSENFSSPPNQPQASTCPIGDSLRRLGLVLKLEWLSACLRELEASVRGFAGLDATAKAKLCFEQFLFADMNSCGSGVLPPNVHSMHLVNLPGPFVLQVDEIVNITCPLRGRYEKATPGIKRCLKLSMTDGIQRVFGIEYRPIQALEVCASSGLKVAISNVYVRRGLLMLVPETIEILGGLVEQLDTARKRLVEELNKPPRGKRTRNGVLPPLATRATLAAWPSSRVDDPGHNRTTMPSTDSVHANIEVTGAGLGMPVTGNSLTTEDTLPMAMGVQNAASNSIPHTNSNAEAMNIDMHADTNSAFLANSMANQFSSMISGAEEMHIDTPNITRENLTGNQSSHMFSNIRMAREDTVHITRENSMASRCSPIAENVETDRDRVDATTENVLLRGSSSTVSNSDVHMVEDSDHPLILPGDQEVPFTYLASLSAKWAAMKENAPLVQGKIKCFLTGVKGFQFKRRATYELQAYVDDGSLISEILIDHHVVQKGIGYSPQEVTAALSSTDTKIVQSMKETMRKFQAFLANFEGVMLVELNKRSSLPLALEMTQGCPQSDAWLLLRRIKSLYPEQVQKHLPSDPIELSP